MPDQKVIEKIKKLLELASSANKEDHERQLAMKRAQELMLKYSIDELHLAEESGRELNITEREYFHESFLKQGVLPVIPSIIATIAPIFGVYGVAHSHGKNIYKFTLFGFEANIEIAKYALDSILNQGLTKARSEYKKFRTITFGMSFWTGYSQGLFDKFGKNLEESQNIVVYDRVKALLDSFATGKVSGDFTDGIAYDTGHQAGLEAEIRKPITSANTGKLLT